MRRCVLIFLLLSLGLVRSAAQSRDNWDSALDRYELICERCLELKCGQDVPKESLASLMNQLAMLRNSLGEVRGQMSAAQRARFDMIRRRFADKAGSAGSAGAPEAPGGAGQPRRAPRRQALEPAPAPVIAVAPLPAVQAPARTPAVRCDARPSALAPASAFPLEPAPAPRPFLAGIQAAPSSAPSFGLFAGALLGKPSQTRLGAYISVRSDMKFTRISPDYVCSADGSIPGGTTIWASGRRESRCSGVNAGLLALFGPRLGAYAGAGRATSALYLQDVESRWARVDTSCEGLSVNIGAIFLLGDRFFLSAGANTIEFKSAEAEIGIGLRF